MTMGMRRSIPYQLFQRLRGKRGGVERTRSAELVASLPSASSSPSSTWTAASALLERLPEDSAPQVQRTHYVFSYELLEAEATDYRTSPEPSLVCRPCALHRLLLAIGRCPFTGSAHAAASTTHGEQVLQVRIGGVRVS